MPVNGLSESMSWEIPTVNVSAAPDVLGDGLAESAACAASGAATRAPTTRAASPATARLTVVLRTVELVIRHPSVRAACVTVAPMPVVPGPPEAPRHIADTELLGTVRRDDYAWMRDLEDPAMRANLAAEREWYDGISVTLAPARDVLYESLAGRMTPTDVSVSWRRGESDLWREIPQGAELAVLRRRPAADSPVIPGQGEVLLDLGVVAAAGGSTYAETGVCELSPDGRWLAWSVDLDGDEVYSLRFRDLGTGVDLAEEAPRTYYGGAWSAGSDVFFYTVPDEAYRPFQVWRHRIGTPAADDVLVRQEDDAHFELVVEASRSGEQVVITAMSRNTTEVHLVPAADPEASPTLVQPRRPGVEYHVEHAPWQSPDGRRDELLIVTDDGATEFRVVCAPTATPGREHWIPVLNEDPDVRVVGVDAFASHYVLTLRRGGSTLLRVVARDGSSSVELHPDQEAGTIALGTNEEFGATFVSVAVESYTAPTVWWDVPLDGSPRRERLRRTVPSYDPEAYESFRVWAAAPDRTAVPITVVRRIGTPLDGTAPCLLYGYGAYEYTYEPLFDRTLPTLLDQGVVFAHAHVRGGGEMGRRWWLQGRLLNKRNSFDDFAAAADALAHDGSLGLVDGARIVGRGGSAGGLLQGACYSLRPDRWRALVAEVPFVDCVNSMLDASLPLTVGEWDEWGDPHQPEYLAYMGSYAPYENLPDPAVRPALLATGAVHDPRVLVHEPAKWVAALRASDPCRGAGRAPAHDDAAADPVAPGVVLFRVETAEGSHGGPAGRFAALRYEAEVQAWILAAMGVAPR